MAEVGNEDVVRKFYDAYNKVAKKYHEGSNGSILVTLMDFYADDATWEDPSGATHDKKGVRKVVEEFYVEPFSNQKWTPDRIVSKGNTVMVEYTWSGKHVKDLAGIPAKGKEFVVRGAEVYVLEAGKIKLYKTYANPNILIQKLRE